MHKNKLDRYFVTIRNKQVVIDRAAAVLYETKTAEIIDVAKRNIESFPSDFMIKLTHEEKQQLKEEDASYAFTEAGVLMLATLIDSDKARNVTFEIIETFTEQQQLLRHIIFAEYKDAEGKKKEEAYMESKLKHILVRSTACI